VPDHWLDMSACKAVESAAIIESLVLLSTALGASLLSPLLPPLLPLSLLPLGKGFGDWKLMLVRTSRKVQRQPKTLTRGPFKDA